MSDSFDASVLVLKILSCVWRAEEKYGVYVIASILCGKANKKVLRFGLEKLSTFGIVSDVSLRQVIAVIRYLLHEGFIFRSALHKNLKLTPKGKLFLKHKPPLVLPQDIVSGARMPLFAPALQSTHKATLYFWKQGRSVENIAILRHLKTTTIEGHVADLVYHKKITEIVQFVEKDTEDMIKSIWEKNPIVSLKELKEQLPEDISYGQIKIVLAAQQRQNR